MNLFNKKNLFLVLIIIFSVYINNTYYYSKLIRKLSEFSFWMSVLVLFFSVASIFLKEDIAKLWRKFTSIFLPISIALILITPTSSHGMDIFPLIKENVTIILALLYSLISIILILYKSFKNN